MKNTCEKDKVVVDLTFDKPFSGILLIQNKSIHEECKKELKNENSFKFEVTRNCTEIGSETKGNFTLVGSIDSRLLISSKSFSMLIQCPPVATSVFKRENILIHLGVADLPNSNLTLIPPFDKNFSNIEIGDPFEIKIDVDPVYKGAYPEKCDLKDSLNNSNVYDFNVCDGEKSVLDPWKWNATANLLTTTFYATTFPDVDEIIFECVIVMCSEACQNTACVTSTTVETTLGIGSTAPNAELTTSAPTTSTPGDLTTSSTTATPTTTATDAKSRRKRSFSLNLRS